MNHIGTCRRMFASLNIIVVAYVQPNTRIWNMYTFQPNRTYVARTLVTHEFEFPMRFQHNPDTQCV